MCWPPPPRTRPWLRRRALAGLGVSPGVGGVRLDRERWCRFESRRPPPPLLVLVGRETPRGDEVEEGGWDRESRPAWVWVLLRVRLSFTPGLGKCFCAAEGGEEQQHSILNLSIPLANTRLLAITVTSVLPYTGPGVFGLLSFVLPHMPSYTWTSNSVCLSPHLQRGWSQSVPKGLNPDWLHWVFAQQDSPKTNVHL